MCLVLKGWQEYVQGAPDPGIVRSTTTLKAFLGSKGAPLEKQQLRSRFPIPGVTNKHSPFLANPYSTPPGDPQRP